MVQQNIEEVLLESNLELEPNPEFISLEAANIADLNCPGCKVSPVEE